MLVATHWQGDTALTFLLFWRQPMASLVFQVGVCGQAFSLSPTFPPVPVPYWAVQWSWFAQVNALCNLSRKKSREVAASLPGQFPSRHRFTLCITMEVEPRIVKQYKYHHSCSCKNYWGKGMEGGKKCLCVIFCWPEDRDFKGKNHFWASCWAVQWSWFAEWMPFVIFRTRSRKRSECHFRANFWVGIASCCG